jgi:hypothetical protein
MRDPAPWQKRYVNMLLFACLFGLVVQYLFVGRAAGVSVLLGILGFYSMYFYTVKGRLGGFDQWKGQAVVGWLLIIPVILLAMTYALYTNMMFRVLNSLALPLCLVMQTMVLSRSSKHPWYRAIFLQDVLHQFIVVPLRNVPVPFGMMKSLAPNMEKPDSVWGKLRKVVFGLLLSAPILFVVIALLASADRIFQSWLSEIPRWIGDLSLADGILRIGVAVGIALYTFCYLWGILFPKTVEAGVPTESLADSPSVEGRKISLDPITFLTFLISINFVYVLFAAIQFSYLFGAAKGLLPIGVAYAEYARRGFAELVLVAVINMGLLLAGLNLMRRTGRVVETLRKLLLTMLIGCTIVMLVSAYGRLSLYEEAYGYTQTRLLVHGFMLFLGILLSLAFFRIWWERISLSKAYIGCAISAYVVMNYANLDHKIAVNNIERYERTGIIDLAYLGELSTDAMPALLKLQAEHPELHSLAETLETMRAAAHDDTWPSWNLSKSRAGKF